MGINVVHVRFLIFKLGRELFISGKMKIIRGLRNFL